jgi:hypothetical protein
MASLKKTILIYADKLPTQNLRAITCLNGIQKNNTLAQI